MNNIENRIIPINAALGSKPGKIRIPSIDIDSTASTYYGLRNNGDGDYEIPTITLGQLMSNYNVEPDVLKMDCEGCEYDIVLNDYEHVKAFKELVLEYREVNNNGLYELLSKLQHDYKYKVIEEY